MIASMKALPAKNGNQLIEECAVLPEYRLTPDDAEMLLVHHILDHFCALCDVSTPRIKYLFPGALYISLRNVAEISLRCDLSLH